jgi:hypothetical protein
MNSPKKYKNKKTPKDLVFDAMKNKKWDYRTIHGISTETKLPESVVTAVLQESESEIRSSIMKTKTGESLYALKRQKSALADVWWAVKKMSKDKYENSDDDT